MRTRPASASLPNESLLPDFGAAWLAFDGFSPKSARGPNTPNLFSAREKWRKFAPSAPDLGDDDNVTTAAVPSSQGTVKVEEAETESTAETQEEKVLPREWVPIVPSTPHTRPRPPKSGSRSSNNNNKNNASTTTAPDSPSLITTPTADTADAAADTSDATSDATDATPTPTPEGTETTETQAGSKLSRRERILHLARQNARTPLPKLAEKPQPPPPPPTEAEMLDEESERLGKERTIRERLWRLVGGNH